MKYPISPSYVTRDLGSSTINNNKTHKYFNVAAALDNGIKP
jgi:hypothetical protein